MPERVQLKRTKGWRLPENTVSVARPGRWGNPFSIQAAIDCGFTTREKGAAFVVYCFRTWLGAGQAGRDVWQGPESDLKRRPFVDELSHLRGKNLGCWCKLGDPCHADVLLEMANR